MARNEAYLEHPPEKVWEVLSDPECYPRWVVGPTRVIKADVNWPQPGSAFEYEARKGPLRTTDRTKVCEAEPHKRLVLDAAAQPFGRARIVLSLQADGTGTRMTFVENPAGHASPLKYLPPIQLLLRVRNAEALRRFKKVTARKLGSPR